MGLRSVQSELFEKRLETLPRRSMRNHNRVIRFFPDTHLGNGHDGLARIASKNNVDVRNLGWGEFVVFMNSRCSALKMYSQGGLIAHLKMPGNGRIAMETIALIPRFFNGTNIDYQGSLAETIRRELEG